MSSNKNSVQPKSQVQSNSQTTEEINKIIKNNFNNMDENNKAATTVMLDKGPDKAAEFMMSSAGMDYSRMRSMYG